MYLTLGILNPFNEYGFSIENIVGFNRIPWRHTGYLLHSRCSNTRTLDEHLKGKPASEVGSASATDGRLQRHRYTTWQAADTEPFETNSSLERNLLSISKLLFFFYHLRFPFTVHLCCRCLEWLMCLYWGWFWCHFGSCGYQALWFLRSSKGIPTISPEGRSCLFAQIYINLINLPPVQPAQNLDWLRGWRDCIFSKIKWNKSDGYQLSYLNSTAVFMSEAEMSLIVHCWVYKGLSRTMEDR